MIQTYIYFHRGNTDSALSKSVIGFIWILDTLHQIFICHVTYTYTVTRYGDITPLQQQTWSMIAVIVISAFMDLGVRSMFCIRVWRFSGENQLLLAVVTILSLGTFGTMLAIAVEDVFKLHLQFDVLPSLSALVYCNVISAVGTDALLAIAQVVLFHKRGSSVPKTVSVIRKLIVYSINTCLLSSFGDLLVCITWATMPNNLVYDVFFAVRPTLLFNALLASLNARHELREMIDVAFDLTSTPMSFAAPSPRAITAAFAPTPGRDMADVYVQVKSAGTLDQI